MSKKQDQAQAQAAEVPADTRKPYRIRDGHAFVLNDHRMFGGERIMLEDDVAALHADKIDPISPEEIEAEIAAAEQAAKDRAAAAGVQTSGTDSDADA